MLSAEGLNASRVVTVAAQAHTVVFSKTLAPLPHAIFLYADSHKLVKLSTQYSTNYSEVHDRISVILRMLQAAHARPDYGGCQPKT
jgi:hypothetical protein